MILINFKTYEEMAGNGALQTAKIAEKIARETKQKVIVIPAALDVGKIAEKTKIDVYMQHVDEKDYGKNTGSILIEEAKKAGAKGAIINHSENRIPTEKIEKIIEKAKKLDFTIIVCVKDFEEAKKIDLLKPDYIAYEPPEFIASDISVSTAKPEVIEKIVKNLNTKIIVGAGVRNRHDVKKSMELGAKGVLLASEIAKAVREKKVEETIKELAEGLK